MADLKVYKKTFIKADLSGGLLTITMPYAITALLAVVKGYSQVTTHNFNIAEATDTVIKVDLSKAEGIDNGANHNEIWLLYTLKQ